MKSFIKKHSDAIVMALLIITAISMMMATLFAQLHMIDLSLTCAMVFVVSANLSVLIATLW